MRTFRPLVFLGVLTVITSCGGGGGDGGVTPPPPPQTLGSISLDPPAMSLIVTQKSTFLGRAFDTSGGAINGATGFTFTSSTPATATVSASGEVTALALGQTTITASLTRDGVTKTTTASVQVVPGTFPLSSQVVANATSDTFAPKTIDIRVGGTVTFRFLATEHNVVFTAQGAPQNIPNTSNRDVDRTFNNAGTFDYDCTLHAGMSGRVIVH
jgi:plastocyanin